MKKIRRVKPKNSKTPSVANVYELLRPIILISILSGLCTIWKSQKYTSHKIALWSVCFCAIITLVGFVHLLAIPFGMCYIEERSSNETDVKSQQFVAKLFNPIIVSTVATIYRIFALFQMHKSLPLLLWYLNEVDKTLKMDNEHFKMGSLVVNIFVAVSLVISWPFQIYSVSVLAKGYLLDFILFFINVYNNYTAACCELQFIAFSWMIAIRFQLVHEKLEKLNDSISRQQNQQIIIENQDFTAASRPDLAGKVLNLKYSHHLLSEACSFLNKTYNKHLFLSLSTLAINVLINLYFAIFGGFRQAATTDVVAQPLPSIINSIIWSIYYFCRFVCVCAAADYLVSKGNATKISICNILRGCLNQDAKEELCNFLNYAMAREFKITAYGFFQIDFTLVTAAVATGTTYLVILAQFHKG